MMGGFRVLISEQQKPDLDRELMRILNQAAGLDGNVIEQGVKPSA